MKSPVAVEAIGPGAVGGGEQECLYSWNIVRDDRPGPCGVSDDRQVALREMAAALRQEAPGARAVLHAVRVNPMETAVYDYGAMIAYAEHDSGTGAIIWHRA